MSDKAEEDRLLRLTIEEMALGGEALYGAVQEIIARRLDKALENSDLPANELTLRGLLLVVLTYLASSGTAEEDIVSLVQAHLKDLKGDKPE
jgi:hypothetical protein